MRTWHRLDVINTFLVAQEQQSLIRSTFRTNITWHHKIRQYALGDVDNLKLAKFKIMSQKVKLDFRREKNNCRICFSADNVADVKLSGAATAGQVKVGKIDIRSALKNPS